MNHEELKYLDRELYSVETDRYGKKWVHVLGYCYQYCDDDTYRCTETCSSMISVDDIEKCADECGVEELLLHFFDEAKQYIGEVTEEEAAKYYSSAKELKISSVHSDTPDGLYVNY